MKAVLGRKDIEKIIRRHLPHLTPISWNGGDLMVDIDYDKLRKETINGQEVWLSKRPAKVRPGKYSICAPIMQPDKSKQVFQIVVQ